MRVLQLRNTVLCTDRAVDSTRHEFVTMLLCRPVFIICKNNNNLVAIKN